MVSVTKRFTFDAAHRLPNHQGKCARPHGHTYVVEVTCTAPETAPLDGSSEEGMVVDFGLLKLVWASYLEPRLDHHDLNQTLAGEVVVTTAESLAQWIMDTYREHLPPMLGEERAKRVRVTSVRVWETPTCYAEVTLPWAP